jgi:hypothetical protein
VILSVDGRGVVTLHYPESEDKDPILDQYKKTFLSTSYELDDAPDFERFFFITSKSEIDVQAILNSAKVLAKHPKTSDPAEPDVRTFYTEMGKLQSQIEKSKADYGRVEFIFYYSGHSDEDYILLGDEKISYKNLRDTINGINADVRIAILDSCASGAFTRIKGGKKRLPFLMDSAYDMRGFAVMTSSSANEASFLLTTFLLQRNSTSGPQLWLVLEQVVTAVFSISSSLG